jgi:hypothetical protein
MYQIFWTNLRTGMRTRNERMPREWRRHMQNVVTDDP